MKILENFIEPIGYESAAKYIAGMVKSPLFDVMDGYISGIFDAKPIQKLVKRRNVKGVIFWYCNFENSKIPYLAYQGTMEEYDEDPEWLKNLTPNRPIMHNRGLKIFKNLVKKNYSKRSSFPDLTQEILLDIQNEPEQNVNEDLDRFDSGNMMFLKNRFLNNQSSYLSFPFAYFSTKYGGAPSYFQEFFDQADVPIMRYYIGFSEEEVFDKQNIRLILAPCNIKGETLKKSDCTKSHLKKFNEPILLQNSWPPRPSGGS